LKQEVRCQAACRKSEETFGSFCARFLPFYPIPPLRPLVASGLRHTRAPLKTINTSPTSPRCLASCNLPYPISLLPALRNRIPTLSCLQEPYEERLSRNQESPTLLRQRPL